MTDDSNQLTVSQIKCISLIPNISNHGSPQSLEFCVITGSQCYCIDAIKEKKDSFSVQFYQRRGTDTAAWILRVSGRKDLKVTYAVHWLNILLGIVLARLSKLDMGSVSMHQNSCSPLCLLYTILNFHPKPKDKPSLSEYHAYEVFQLIVDPHLTLAFIFCNIFHLPQFFKLV